MPKDKGDIDLTPEQAEENVKKHLLKHGTQMKVPPGQEKKHDVPTQEEIDADPEWFKQGKARPAHPDD